MIARLALAAWRHLRATLFPDAKTALAGLAVIAVVVTLDRLHGNWIEARDAARSAEARIARLEAELAVRSEAAAVHRAHRDRLARVAAERAELIRELQQMEGADAPLPDPLAGAARRLWPVPGR